MVTTHIMTLLMFCIIFSADSCPVVQTVNARMSKHSAEHYRSTVAVFELLDLLWVCMQPDPPLLT